MKRFLTALAATLALLASGSVSSAQTPPDPVPPECNGLPAPSVECVIEELKTYVTNMANDAAFRAYAQAQLGMWELYQAQEGLPDVEIPDEGLPAFDFFRVPGDPTFADTTSFRGAFYYPWYPEDWGTCTGGDPSRSHFNPTRGCYSQDPVGDPPMPNPVIREHIDDMLNAGINVAISSWYRTDPPAFTTRSKRDIRFIDLLNASLGTDLKWALYYEREGHDPNLTWAKIRSDLNYAMSMYGEHDNYLRYDNGSGAKPVVFVFADENDGCGDGVDPANAGPTEMLERWRHALTQTTRRTTVPIPNLHPVMKVFPGYSSCPANTYPRTDFSFHQYAPAAATDQQHPAVATSLAPRSVGNGSYVISPGFWHFNDATPRDNLPTGPGTEDSTRDLVEFRASVRGQVASSKFWQLITTYNEFIEGTQVESDTRFGNIYLEALASDGAEPAISGTVMGAGDIACGPEHPVTSTTCKQTETSDLMVGRATAVLAIGDLQYEDGTLTKFQSHYDPSWGRVYDITRPAIGNHEYNDTSDPSDPPGDGHFDYWGPRAGPRRPAVGTSGEAVYTWGHGGWNFLVLNGSCSQVSPGMGGCGVGSLQYNFVNDYLNTNSSRCEVAYVHFPRWSDGQHGNTDRPDTNLALSPLYDLLVQHGVELLLVGHDHDYQRFPMAADDAAGVGVIMPEFGVRQIVVGTGGKNHTSVDTSDPLGSDIDPEVWNDETFGVLRLDLRPNDGTFRFIPIAGQTFTDGPLTVTCHS